MWQIIVKGNVSLVDDTLTDEALTESGASLDDVKPAAAGQAEMGLHQSLKKKFIEGNAGFMSLVALALVLGLAFCIERIIYLSLSEIDAKRFMGKIEEKIQQRDIEGERAEPKHPWSCCFDLLSGTIANR